MSLTTYNPIIVQCYWFVSVQYKEGIKTGWFVHLQNHQFVEAVPQSPAKRHYHNIDSVKNEMRVTCEVNLLY